ncbi:hypothetical protein BDP27DRAFT_1339194, partial [Rhodocollybia butyracea]
THSSNAYPKLPGHTLAMSKFLLFVSSSAHGSNSNPNFTTRSLVASALLSLVSPTTHSSNTNLNPRLWHQCTFRSIEQGARCCTCAPSTFSSSNTDSKFTRRSLVARSVLFF